MRRTSSNAGSASESVTQQTFASPLGVVRASFGLRNLTVDVGLVSLGASRATRRSLVLASQSLALALGGRALALVGAPLTLVRRPFALIRDSIALIGYPIPPACQPLTPLELDLTPSDVVLALVELFGPAVKLI